MNRNKIKIDNLNLRIRGVAPATVRESLQDIELELAARLINTNTNVVARDGKPNELRGVLASRIVAALAEHLRR